MTQSLEPIGGDRCAGDDDRALVDAIRAGSDAAFFTLFHGHYEVLCRYVYRYVGSRAIAEELVSDVFLRVWAQRERWEVRGRVRAYLYGAARNLAIDHLRRERVEQRLLDASGREQRANVEARASGGWGGARRKTGWRRRSWREPCSGRWTSCRRGRGRFFSCGGSGI